MPSLLRPFSYRALCALFLFAALWCVARAQGGANAYQAAVSAQVINGGGVLLLALTNNSANELKLTAIIGLGEPEPREIGQVALTLPAQGESLFRLQQVPITSAQYSLRLLNASGRPLLFQVGRLQSGALATQAIDLTLAPINTTKPEASRRAPLTLATNTASAIIAPSAGPLVLPDEVTVTARLLAGQRETDSPVLALELAAIRPTYDLQLTVTLGKFKERKPININRLFVTEVRLPGNATTLAGEAVRYELTGKKGRIIARGELRLDLLLAEDSLGIADLQFDKNFYEAGDTIRLTIALAGQSANGYRLEALAQDSSGTAFFREQREGQPGAAALPQEFTLTLPKAAARSFTFEFKLFDAKTGALLDSGTRELPVKGTSN